MNVNPAPNASKRPLEYSDQYGSKRPQPAQPELDIEALVAELNQQTQQAGSAGSYDDSQSLEKQLEGALASLNAQSVDPPHPAHAANGLQYPMHTGHPGVHYGQHMQNQLAVPSQVGIELPRHSAEYEAQLESQLEGKITTASVTKDNAFTEAKKRCLPILDSLACQVLEYLSLGNYQEVLNLIAQPETERGRSFKSIIDIFEQAKKMFLENDEPFLHYTPEFRDNRITLQRVNLASWCCAAFGVIDIGFYDLDKWFIATFVPENSRLLKSQTSVFLELKTQAYISSLSQTQKGPDAVLEELFPSDLSTRMVENRSERQTLNNSESDFVTRCAKRRENIEGHTDQIQLAKTYQWIFFLRDLSEYISKHHYTLLPHPAQQLRNAQLQKKQQQEEAAAAAAAATGGANKAQPQNPSQSQENTVSKSPGEKSDVGDSQQILASQQNEVSRTPQPPSASKPKQHRRELGEEAKLRAQQNNGKLSDTNTLSVYQTARASSEGVENTRPVARTSVMTRRAWSKEEEEALLKGLDQVQGPYWSQILELYGPGGSISEVLKDRTQVQLKDKARNLKMFFVRCNLPIPAVFQYVTGNYETRKSSGRKARDKKRGEESRQSPVPGHHVGSPGHRALPHHMGMPGAMPGMQGNVPPIMQNNMGGHVMPQPEQDVQQSAEVLDRALSMLKGESDDNIQHLIQSVGDYINNQ